jgi:hypothetical protein
VSTVDAGWLPQHQRPTVTPSPWTGDLKWQVPSGEGWSQDAWFNPPSIDVTVVVGLHTVEVYVGGQLFGLVARDELRTWFAHGTTGMPAGEVTWTSRPMGVALGVPGCSPWPVPSEIATHLASHL